MKTQQSKFSVKRGCFPDGPRPWWYIAVSPKNGGGYLHSDLTTRHSTYNDANQPTGWYTTRERARTVVKLAKTI